MFAKRKDFRQRFGGFLPTSITETGCMIWTGSPNSAGYGTIRMPGRHGRTVLAHRVAYEFAFGGIPDGLCVCHKCDVRLCVNPSHLFLGTNAENIRDRDNKGRCRAAGKPGEGCGRSKLKTDQVLAILKDTRTHREIAEDYGMSRTAITNIKPRRTWKHLRTLGKWKE